MARLQRLKKAATVVGTFAVALLIGFVMQYGDADASRFSDASAAEQRNKLPAQVDTSPLARATALQPKVPAPVQLNANPFDSVRLGEESVKLTALVSEVAQSAIDEVAAITTPQDAETCAIDLSVTPDDQAVVQLTVYSFCRAEMPFEISHHDLIITGVTDVQGRADLAIPALMADASFSILFEDGGVAESSVAVPGTIDFTRIVFQWTGAPAEFLRKDASQAIGTLTQLGSATSTNSHFAEVFTFPASYPVAEGLRVLSVQAEVSEETCGRQLDAQTFRIQSDTDPALKDIRITLPGCEHVGTFLELKKVLGGQTLLQ